jgi:hypothetical protein
MQRLAIVITIVGWGAAAHAVAADPCLNVPADATVPYAANGYSGVTAMSPDGSYAKRLQCPHYVVDFTSTQQQAVELYAAAPDWWTHNPDEAHCAQARLALEGWGWVPGIISRWIILPGHWERLGSLTRVGAWVPNGHGGGSCDLSPNESTVVWSSASSPYSALRVVGDYDDGSAHARVLDGAAPPTQ